MDLLRKIARPLWRCRPIRFQIQMMSLVRGPWQAGRMEPKRITTITIIITIISPEHRME
jgi:hypothetical protein